MRDFVLKKFATFALVILKNCKTMRKFILGYGDEVHPYCLHHDDGHPVLFSCLSDMYRYVENCYDATVDTRSFDEFLHRRLMEM